MANILQIKNIGQKIARILYRDMGDGTHAEAVSVTPVSDTQPGLAANTQLQLLLLLR